MLRGIVGIDVLRLKVNGILGPGRKKLLLYRSEVPSLERNSSLVILHFPSAKTLFSASLPLSVIELDVLLCGFL